MPHTENPVILSYLQVFYDMDGAKLLALTCDELSHHLPDGKGERLFKAIHANPGGVIL